VLFRSTWKKFENIGRIRVGIKTTADNVFINGAWENGEKLPELLRPLITHRNAGQIISNNTNYGQVLYTHTTENGMKISYNIEQYPNSLNYLLKHRVQLEARSYIKKANRNWYEIWVPQNPEAWQNRKIVFRDIADMPQFWLDESGAVVNGDCYWIDVFDSTSEDEILLALAVANSDFIQKYYDLKFNNKLYAGKRRYMSQYVEQFPIPNPSTELAQNVIGLVKEIIRTPTNGSLRKELNNKVYSLFA
jgi:hypothetical protein